MKTKQIRIRENRVEINYLQKGEGETTLLFLHGWCINGMYWENQIDYFAGRYSVCAIDLPGFGKSKAERTNWTIEEYANDVTAFIETLNLKKVVLIGHSMAGEIMLQTALYNNPRIIGVVGVDNFKFIDVAFSPEVSKQITDFFPMLEKDFKNAAPFYADLMLFHPTTPNEVRERVKNDFASCDAVIGYNSFMNFMKYSATDAQKLEQLNYRLFLVNSSGSPTNESGLANHCKKGFQVEAVSATGHFPMIEKPADFNLLLDSCIHTILSDK